MWSNIIANKVYYLDGGTSIITRNMQETLDITCNATVTDVTEHDDGVTVSVTDKSGSESSISAQHCVVATDPVALAKLLRNWLKPEQLDFLTSYNYGRFIYVGLGLEGSTAESAYLLQIPAKEHPELVGIALDHNRSQAPNQKSVVTTFFLDEWSERMAGASDETIRDLAIEAVSPFIPEVKSSVVEYHVKHTEPGVTMSKVGDYRKLAAFTAALNDDSPIRIVGDFFSMSSMNTCVARADVASQSIIRAAQNT